MNKEQKQLLIKDLCDRLPYGVNVLHVKEDIIGVLSTINIYLGNNAEGKQKLMCTTSFFGEDNVPIEEFKPYLYPLSSMTEVQKEFLRKQNWCIAISTSGTIETTIEGFDWLNKHHFDYRGLIEQGLAIDATGVVMYNKEV